MVKGIIFDMDGVLADTELFYQRRREKFLEEMQYVRTEDHDFVGSNEKAIWETIVPDDPVLRKKLMMGYREYRENHPEPYEELVNPQVHPLFQELRRRGIRIEIASSSDRESIGRMMQAADIMELTDYVISGLECSAHKPDPEIYLRAMEALGLSAEEAIAVEDSPTGIQAALRAGLKVCALRPGHGMKMDQSAATVVMTELREVLNWIN